MTDNSISTDTAIRTNLVRAMGALEYMEGSASVPEIGDFFELIDSELVQLQLFAEANDLDEDGDGSDDTESDDDTEDEDE